MLKARGQVVMPSEAGRIRYEHMREQHFLAVNFGKRPKAARRANRTSYRSTSSCTVRAAALAQRRN